MLDFETELNKLLSRETEPLPQYEFAPMVEMAAFGQELLSLGKEQLEGIRKKQADVSLQVEEIYDLLNEQDTRVLEEALGAEKKRADMLALGAIALCDLLEDFCVYARLSGSEELKHQAELLWTQSGQLLSGNNIVRIGMAGQPLNPQIHTVQKGVESPFPREQVVEVLQSGYVYKNALVRKAAVVVSTGPAKSSETAGPAASTDSFWQYEPENIEEKEKEEANDYE
jgi:molecular chaperone GrpE (heat shock protein)